MYVVADQIQGNSDVETIADGAVDMRRGNDQILADHLTYNSLTDEMEANGNVELRRNDDQMRGPHLKLNLGDNEGSFETPAYTLKRIPKVETGQPAGKPLVGRGVAEQLDFEGENQYHFRKTTYSTCEAGPQQNDWYARIADLKLDYDQDLATGSDATVYFKGVPVLYTPMLSFALNNQRKSGLLPPTVGGTSQSGLEVIAPYYWNIAPNMDATLSPRLLTKRGVEFMGELRYLGAGYSGQLNGEVLPNDRVFHGDRSALSLVHTQSFGNGFLGLINASRVSDDSYFTDLSSRLTNISQTYLLRQGQLFYGASWWNASLLVQRYQVLQAPGQPLIGHPYERLPQFTVTAIRPDLPAGLLFNFTGDYAKFSNPDQTLTQGNRTILYPQISLPMQTAAFYLTPKIGLHSTQYRLDQQPVGTPSSLSRNVPIFSVDSGVTFERDMELFGRTMTQTLEPRLYYLKVPRRDQSLYPIFDTGIADFNFAQIFSENIFTGGDRIADANQLTAAISSRIIDPLTGNEDFKVMLGQRYYFTDQYVTFPGQTPRTSHLANYLAGVTARVNVNTFLDSALEYDPQAKQVQRFNLTSRYQPETGKLINAGYRFTRDLLNQIDISGQWPLMPGWSVVGRYNYSFKDKREIETIAGLEYNAGCWSTRFVIQQLATAIGQTSSAFFIQLELNGFSRLGSNPLDMLRRSVPGYGRTIQPSSNPIFGTN